MRAVLVHTWELFLSSGVGSRCFHALLADLLCLCNSYGLKVRAVKGFILLAANRSLLFSTIAIQLKEKSANDE